MGLWSYLIRQMSSELKGIFNDHHLIAQQRCLTVLPVLLVSTQLETMQEVGGRQSHIRMYKAKKRRMEEEEMGSACVRCKRAGWTV